MASLLKNVSNSILHAFNALQQEKPGFVNKSKLKVNVSIFGHIFNTHASSNAMLNESLL